MAWIALRTLSKSALIGSSVRPLPISRDLSRKFAITGTPACTDAPAPSTNTISLMVGENALQTAYCSNLFRGVVRERSTLTQKLKDKRFEPIVFFPTDL